MDSFTSHLSAARNASKHTVSSYHCDLKQFIVWLEAELLLTGEQGFEGVAPKMILRYLGYLSQQGYNRRSVVRKLSSFRAFFRWLEREGAIPSNPAVGVLAPKTPRSLPNVMSTEEVEKLLALPNLETAYGKRDRALLEVLYAAGLRVAEASALRLGDIDWSVGELRVIGGKGNKDRVVLLGSYAIAALKEYMKEARTWLLDRRKEKLAPICENVWVNSRGTRLSPHAIYILVQEYSVRAGITTKVTPHTFRHSFATHLLTNGADLRVVQELLGHSNLSSTQIYTRVSAAHLKNVYDQAHPRAKLE